MFLNKQKTAGGYPLALLASILLSLLVVKQCQPLIMKQLTITPWTIFYYFTCDVKDMGMFQRPQYSN